MSRRHLRESSLIRSRPKAGSFGVLLAAAALAIGLGGVAAAQDSLVADGPSAEVQYTVSCLAENGRVDINIVNTGTAAAEYRIEFAGLSARQRTVASLDWWRMPVSGRADGTYQIVVRRDGAVVSDVPVQVACDVAIPLVTEPEVRIVNACRADNGYVLFLFANATAQPKPYLIEFGALANRSTTAAAYGQSVRAATGRPDGPHSFVVRSGSDVVVTGTVVVRCDGAGEDPVAPTPPTNLIVRADQLTATSAGIRWDAASDNVGVVGYRLYLNGVAFESVGAGETGFVFTDLVPDTRYSFGVSAIDGAGNESAIVAAGARTSDDGADREAPTAPQNLIVRADQLTATSAGLRWDPATDNVGVTGYRIAVNGVDLVTLPSTATSYVVDDLTPATGYSFTVVALDEAGNRSAIASTGITTPSAAGGDDSQAPSVPGNKIVRADQLTATTAGIKWSPATDNVGVAGYRIYVNGTFIKQTAADVSEYIVMGLSPGTTYSFGVSAIDAAGNESEAALAGAMTLGGPGPGEQDADYYDELIPIPDEYVHPVFGSLDSPRASYMESVLGDPNIANGDQNCSVDVPPDFEGQLETRRFENMEFRVRAFPAVLEAIERVMDRVQAEHPGLWANIEHAGAFCHRNQRGSNTPSNHAFGTAIDFYVLPAAGVDLDRNGLAQRGMVILGQYFQEEGFKWGAYFRSGTIEDVPHMEASRELVEYWASTGELP